MADTPTTPTIVNDIQKGITAIEKFKGLALCILVVLFCIVFVKSCLIPKPVIKTVTDTKEVDTWKAKYQSVVTQLNKEIAKNVSTKIITIYGDNGKVKSIENDRIDLSKINSQSTTTTTTTVTTAGKTIETIKTVAKYSRTAILLGINENGVFADIRPSIAMQVDNWEFGIDYGIIRKEWGIGVKFTVIAW